MIAPLFIVCGLALQEPAPLPAPESPGAAPRHSIQELLARLRRLRDERLGELEGGVQKILDAMQLDGERRRLDALAEARTKLVAFGQESAPLLVEAIDPGLDPTDAQRLRSLYVLQAVIELASRAVAPRLAEIARKGSPEGRVNAVKALAASPDRDRAASVLAGIYADSSGQLRRAALSGLARLGGPDNDRLLTRALADADPATVRLALEALADARAVGFGPRVLQFAAVTHEAVPHVAALLAYYRACPEVVDKAHLLALVRLAQDFAVSTEARGSILELVPRFSDKVDNEVRKELRTIAESPSREIREAALVALVQVGDRNARKELLADYDAQVDRNKGWANSWQARANILYRIGDYREAIKDYQKALQLAAGDFRARQDETYIGLARCYAAQGKHKDAAATIEKAPISLKQLGEMAQEPVFAEMVANPKYRGVFRLD